MVVSDDILSEMEFVKKSEKRTKVMKSLDDGEILMPSQLSKALNIPNNHISATLAVLKRHGLVECINPEIRKGKLYRHTDKGRAVAECMRK